jgi:hypothetical protein
MFTIYKLECNGDYYIGSTTNYSLRKKQHLNRSVNPKYSDYPLYKQMNESPYSFSILEQMAGGKVNRLECEQKWMNELKPVLNQRDAVFNIDKHRETNKLRMRSIVQSYTDETKIIESNKKKIWYENNKEKVKQKRRDRYKITGK